MRWFWTQKSGDSVANGSRDVALEASWRRSVLIVEDDREMWPILERFSAQADPSLQVEFASNVDEAKEKLAGSTRYDVVLTDYCLPRPGEGKAIRNLVASLQPDARVGMISALMGFNPKDKSTPYLAKPFTPQTYRRFLRELLEPDAAAVS